MYVSTRSTKKSPLKKYNKNPAEAAGFFAVVRLAGWLKSRTNSEKSRMNAESRARTAKSRPLTAKIRPRTPKVAHERENSRINSEILTSTLKHTEEKLHMCAHS